MLPAQCLSIFRECPHCDLLPMAHYTAWVVAHLLGRWAGRPFLHVSKARRCLQGVGEDCSGPLAFWLPNTRGRKGQTEPQEDPEGSQHVRRT